MAIKRLSVVTIRVDVSEVDPAYPSISEIKRMGLMICDEHDSDIFTQARYYDGGYDFVTCFATAEEVNKLTTRFPGKVKLA